MKAQSASSLVSFSASSRSLFLAASRHCSPNLRMSQIPYNHFLMAIRKNEMIFLKRQMTLERLRWPLPEATRARSASTRWRCHQDRLSSTASCGRAPVEGRQKFQDLVQQVRVTWLAYHRPRGRSDCSPRGHARYFLLAHPETAR